ARLCRAKDDESEGTPGVTVLDVCSSSGNDDSDEDLDYASDSSEALDAYSTR
ncbi:hypothetical protein GN958_ATG05459, partial [Phytophthora infestans]